MIKKTFLVAALASLVATAACKKDEKKDAESAPKTTDTATTDKATDTAATPDKPAEEAPAETSGDMSKEELAEKAVGLFKAMNEAAKAGAGDCDKIGADLAKLVQEAKPIIEAGNKMDEDPEAKKWFDETYGEEMETLMGEMMGSLAPCMDNEAVKSAFEGLE